MALLGRAVHRGSRCSLVWAFCSLIAPILFTMYKWRVESQQKSSYVSYFHRMFTKTNPWEPTDIYLVIAAHGCGGKECLRYLRSLHAPLVPEATPDRRDDPVGFEKVMKLAKLQEMIHDGLKDESLLDDYRRRYRNDPGICARYIRYLQRTKPRAAKAVINEGRRLFPDADLGA